jgi:hypothetical protein
VTEAVFLGFAAGGGFVVCLWIAYLIGLQSPHAKPKPEPPKESQR